MALAEAEVEAAVEAEAEAKAEVEAEVEAEAEAEAEAEVEAGTGAVAGRGAASFFARCSFSLVSIWFLLSPNPAATNQACRRDLVVLSQPCWFGPINSLSFHFGVPLAPAATLLAAAARTVCSSRD